MRHLPYHTERPRVIVPSDWLLKWNICLITQTETKSYFSFWLTSEMKYLTYNTERSRVIDPSDWFLKCVQLLKPGLTSNFGLLFVASNWYLDPTLTKLEAQINELKLKLTASRRLSCQKVMSLSRSQKILPSLAVDYDYIRLMPMEDKNRKSSLISSLISHC